MAMGNCLGDEAANQKSISSTVDIISVTQIYIPFGVDETGMLIEAVAV